MKRSLILIALVLAIFALPFEATVRAEAPPTFIGAGALFRNGGSTEFAMQAGLNVFRNTDEDSGQVSTSYTYGVARFFYADDVGLDSATIQQLEAVSGYIVREITSRNFFALTGGGIIAEFQEGDNLFVPAVLLELGWQPMSLLRITVGGQYIPVVDMGDLVFVYGGVGIRF